MEAIMQYLHNYFYRFKEKGKFTVKFNSVTIDGENLKGTYVNGQYVRIVGSVANDGVYKVVSCGSQGMKGLMLQGCLSDEVFEGYICSLSVPKSFIKLSEDVQRYNKEHSNDTGMISESFGGYSYTRATINGRVATWEDVYKSQLAPYRRMSDGFQFVKEVK